MGEEQKNKEAAPSVAQVMEWIQYYKANKKSVTILQEKYQHAVQGKLISQWGLGAVMPKPQGRRT